DFVEESSLVFAHFSSFLEVPVELILLCLKLARVGFFEDVEGLVYVCYSFLETDHWQLPDVILELHNFTWIKVEESLFLKVFSYEGGRDISHGGGMLYVEQTIVQQVLDELQG